EPPLGLLIRFVLVAAELFQLAFLLFERPLGGGVPFLIFFHQAALPLGGFAERAGRVLAGGRVHFVGGGLLRQLLQLLFGAVELVLLERLPGVAGRLFLGQRVA